MGVVTVFFVILGLGAGFAVGWLLAQRKSSASLTDAKVKCATSEARWEAGENEIKGLIETLKNREIELTKLQNDTMELRSRKSELQAIREKDDTEIAGLHEIIRTREIELKDLSNSIVELSSRQSELQAIREKDDTEIAGLHEIIRTREIELKDLSNSIVELSSRQSELQTIIEKERKAAEEKLAILQDAQVKLTETFQNLAHQALKSNNQTFLQLAEESLQKFQKEAKGDLEQRKTAIEGLIKPLHESLKNYNDEIQKVRIAEGSLLDQVKTLKSETETLSRSLRQPQVKGRWGEYTLKRAVELAGMSEYCDFTTQENIMDGRDKRLRPDLIIYLPGDKRIVVDAKTSLSAYLEAMETSDEVKRHKHMQDHTRLIKAQVKNLGSKSYWEQFDFTPDFVVMFLPGDHFLSAALDIQPDLFEEAVQNRVLLSTPVNFIALLKTVAMIWRQEKIAESAMIISQLGKELYDRLETLTGHFQKLGGYLDKSVHSFNDTLKSLEGRVLVTARKFGELGITVKKEIPQIESIDRITHEPKKIDWP